MAALDCFIFISLLSSCLAAKYAMFPMFTRSHYLVFAKLGEELTARGHEVSYKNRLTLLIRLSELFCLQFLLAGSVKFQMIKNLIFQVSFRRKTAFWCNCYSSLICGREKYCKEAGQHSLLDY